MNCILIGLYISFAGIKNAIHILHLAVVLCLHEDSTASFVI